MVVSLWLQLIKVPGLFERTEWHIYHQDLDGDTITALINRILKQIKLLYIWYKKYAHHLEEPNEIPSSAAVKSASKDDIQCVLQRVRRAQLHKTYLATLIILYRLLLALAPARFHNSESRCQSLARKVGIQQKQLEASHQPILGGLFGTFTCRIAQSAIQTGDQWQNGQIYTNREVIDRDTFSGWCRAFGRKVSPDDISTTSPIASES